MKQIGSQNVRFNAVCIHCSIRWKQIIYSNTEEGKKKTTQRVKPEAFGQYFYLHPLFPDEFAIFHLQEGQVDADLMYNGRGTFD